MSVAYLNQKNDVFDAESSHCRVMIIDDDPDDIFIMTRALDRVSRAMPYPLVAETAENGKTALHMLQECIDKDSLPDIVLLDLNMPILDGFEVLKMCRAMIALHEMPIIVMTTARDEPTLSKAKELGATAVYSKPETGEEMAKLLDETLQSWFID